MDALPILRLLRSEVELRWGAREFGGRAPVLAPRLVPVDPGDLGTRHRVAGRPRNQRGQPVLHVVVEMIVYDEYRRLARRTAGSASHCAIDARYSSLLERVAALRRSSREIVDGAHPTSRAIARTPRPRVRNSVTSLALSE